MRRGVCGGNLQGGIGLWVGGMILGWLALGGDFPGERVGPLRSAWAEPGRGMASSGSAILAWAPADPGPLGPDEQAQRLAEADRRAEEALSEAASRGASSGGGRSGSSEQETARFNFLETTLKGGPLMIPIGLLSLLALTFIVERSLALRRRKVIPPGLIAGLGKLASQPGGLDPRSAYRLVQRYPSAAANVIRAMLLKVGRPLMELEHTVAEASNREAARLYANVRWLNLTASVAPLIGLLGTVQGMIMAFFVTANLPTGANKAQELANGIYIALVTTFAGLSVAIPAAIAAHFFETQIEKLFRELDQILQGVLPQLERYEGRLRISPEELDRLSVEPPPAPAGRK